MTRLLDKCRTPCDNDCVTTYRLADAPKFASMQAFDCADCGHPELGHPVFLAGPNGTFAVGTGCAARLLGLPLAQLEADLAVTRLTELCADWQVRELWGWMRLCLPGRITNKFTADTTTRFRTVPTETVAEVFALYKAINRVGRVVEVTQGLVAAAR